MADTKLVKTQGEDWACSVLAGLGWAVALTRDGLERTDIVGAEALSGRMIQVQVKAASHSLRPTWALGHNSQIPARGGVDEWFVLVVLAAEPWRAPRGFVVPRDHVAAAAWIGHMDWLTDPSAPAGSHNASVDQARIQDWVFANYEDRWDSLAASATTCPGLLPSRFRQFAQDPRVGLSPEQPWRKSIPKW
jgi:hypothetical protein